MKKKAQQRRGHPVKIRCQPDKSGSYWVVWYSSGKVAHYRGFMPPKSIWGIIYSSRPVYVTAHYKEWSV